MSNIDLFNKYEIKKNGDLSISFNKTEFYYGTEFDLVNNL